MRRFRMLTSERLPFQQSADRYLSASSSPNLYSHADLSQIHSTANAHSEPPPSLTLGSTYVWTRVCIYPLHSCIGVCVHNPGRDTHLHLALPLPGPLDVVWLASGVESAPLC